MTRMCFKHKKTSGSFPELPVFLPPRVLIYVRPFPPQRIKLSLTRASWSKPYAKRPASHAQNSVLVRNPKRFCDIVSSMQHCLGIWVLALVLAAPAEASSLSVSGTKCGSTAFIGNIDLGRPPSLAEKQPNVLERQAGPGTRPQDAEAVRGQKDGAIALLPIEALLPALQAGGDGQPRGAATPTAYLGAIEAFAPRKSPADVSEDCLPQPAP